MCADNIFSIYFRLSWDGYTITTMSVQFIYFYLILCVYRFSLRVKHLYFIRDPINCVYLPSVVPFNKKNCKTELVNNTHTVCVCVCMCVCMNVCVCGT